MTARRRLALLLAVAVPVAALAPSLAVATPAVDYSYVKKGTYKGTAVVPPGPAYVTPAFAGGRYPVSFRLTSPSRTGIRFSAARRRVRHPRFGLRAYAGERPPATPTRTAVRTLRA